MNPAMVRFIVITAVNVGMKIHAQRQSRKTNNTNEVAAYMVSMINDGKVEIDDFDKIALAQLGIKVEQKEEEA
jgi:hypothetical protein